MYVPKSFMQQDASIAFDLVDRYGFATLVSWSSGEPFVTHLPLVLDRAKQGEEQLLGHVARANGHWRRFDGSETALAIFRGPHGYISPAWYETHPSVRTWNYAVVHVHGAPTVVDADQTRAILERLIRKHEARRREPWARASPAEFVEEELRAIVGFRMPITRLVTKFKLGQNRDAADRVGTLKGLQREGDPGSAELAAFARDYLKRGVVDAK